jgi:PIN domain nuclease of toxin-antitoxin system
VTSAAGPILVDTHIFLWYLQGSPRLADSTRALLDDVTARGEPILVSAVTMVELRCLAEKGTLDEPEVDAIHAVLDAEGAGFDIVALDTPVAWAVGGVPRDAVPDPWDRMIAATALIHGVPLVTYDRKLTALASLETVR